MTASVYVLARLLQGLEAEMHSLQTFLQKRLHYARIGTLGKNPADPAGPCRIPAESEVWISYKKWQLRLQERVIRETPPPIPSPKV